MALWPVVVSCFHSCLPFRPVSPSSVSFLDVVCVYALCSSSPSLPLSLPLSTHFSPPLSLSLSPFLLPLPLPLPSPYQVNLEYLGRVVFNSGGMLYPDSLVGTDSHTTMINGLGIVGWGESSFTHPLYCMYVYLRFIFSKCG